MAKKGQRFSKRLARETGTSVDVLALGSLAPPAEPRPGIAAMTDATHAELHQLIGELRTQRDLLMDRRAAPLALIREIDRQVGIIDGALRVIEVS